MTPNYCGAQGREISASYSLEGKLDILKDDLQGLGAPVLIATPFPATSDHNSRHIELGPDNKLYISFGSPANLDYCETYGSINACSIVRMNIDGTELENYVVG